MTWTQTVLNIKDAAGATQPVIAYTDGTNFSFAHPLLDNTGAIISPATQGTLASVLTACQAATPAGTNLMGKVGIDQTTPGTTNLVQLPTSQITTLTPPTTVAVSAVTAITNALPAGTALIGQVASIGSVHLTSAPTVTAGAYTTGQVVGGLISLTGATRVNAGSGLIQSVSVTIKTALTAPFDVFFFDTNPTNSTFTDNSALAINTADLSSLCGVAHCTDLVSGGTPQILQANNLALPFKLSAAATTLYAVIVIRGGQTFASTSAIGMNVLIKQD